MREIVHIQAGQCGNQIGAKVCTNLLFMIFHKFILFISVKFGCGIWQAHLIVNFLCIQRKCRFNLRLIYYLCKIVQIIFIWKVHFILMSSLSAVVYCILGHYYCFNLRPIFHLWSSLTPDIFVLNVREICKFLWCFHCINL